MAFNYKLGHCNVWLDRGLFGTETEELTRINHSFLNQLASQPNIPRTKRKLNNRIYLNASAHDSSQLAVIEAQWCISRNLTPAGCLENIFYTRTCTLHSSAVKSLIYFLPFLVPESHKGKSNFLALTLAGQTGNKKQQIIVFLLVPTNSFLVRKITHTTLW